MFSVCFLWLWSLCSPACPLPPVPPRSPPPPPLPRLPLRRPLLPVHHRGRVCAWVEPCREAAGVGRVAERRGCRGAGVHARLLPAPPCGWRKGGRCGWASGSAGGCSAAVSLQPAWGWAGLMAHGSCQGDAALSGLFSGKEGGAPSAALSLPHIPRSAPRGAGEEGGEAVARVWDPGVSRDFPPPPPPASL